MISVLVSTGLNVSLNLKHTTVLTIGTNASWMKCDNKYSSLAEKVLNCD